MRNTIKAILAGGPVAIATVGAGALYLQHELHYLLRPTVIETAAGIVAVGGGVLWAMGKGKRKASSVDEQVAKLAETLKQEAQSLPPGQRVEYGGHVDYSVPQRQVIDYTAG